MDLSKGSLVAFAINKEINNADHSKHRSDIGINGLG